MNEEKNLEDKLNDLEYLYVRKKMDMEEYIRQRSILMLKLENLKLRNKKKPFRNKTNFNVI